MLEFEVQNWKSLNFQTVFLIRRCSVVVVEKRRRFPDVSVFAVVVKWLNYLNSYIKTIMHLNMGLTDNQEKQAIKIKKGNDVWLTF